MSGAQSQCLSKEVVNGRLKNPLAGKKVCALLVYNLASFLKAGWRGIRVGKCFVAVFTADALFAVSWVKCGFLTTFNVF